MKLCSLASGSSGNASYFVHNNAKFLVDVGVSKRSIETELIKLNEKPEDISAIFITHEHSDHIKGLGPFLRAHPVPVYLTQGTLNKVLTYKTLGKVDSGLFNVITSGCDYTIENVLIRPIATNHDAAEPVAYKFSADDKSVAVVTDLGTYTESLIEDLKEIDACIIEANHDVRMLELGPYPYQLKLRILGKYGHLSNDDCVAFIKVLMKKRLKEVILGHLSKENNLPKIAYETIKQGIEDSHLETPKIFVASEIGHSEWIKA